MKLVRQLQALEAAAEVAKRDLNAPVGICWSSEHVRVTAPLQEGETVACDITITEWIREVPCMTMRERVTRDPSDLGLVFDVEGAEVGRVLELGETFIGYWLRDGERPVMAKSDAQA